MWTNTSITLTHPVIDTCAGGQCGPTRRPHSLTQSLIHAQVDSVDQHVDDKMLKTIQQRVYSIIKGVCVCVRVCICVCARVRVCGVHT